MNTKEKRKTNNYSTAKPTEEDYRIAMKCLENIKDYGDLRGTEVKDVVAYFVKYGPLSRFSTN